MAALIAVPLDLGLNDLSSPRRFVTDHMDSGAPKFGSPSLLRNILVFLINLEWTLPPEGKRQSLDWGYVKWRKNCSSRITRPALQQQCRYILAHSTFTQISAHSRNLKERGLSLKKDWPGAMHCHEILIKSSSERHFSDGREMRSFCNGQMGSLGRHSQGS